MAEPKVHFVEQTQAEYDASLAHSSSTIYFCTDTKKIYKGDDEYCASGSGNDFVVTYTNNGGTYTADKTFEDIQIAFEEGKNIKAKSGSGIYSLYRLDDYYITFTEILTIQGQTPEFKIVSIMHGDDNRISKYEKTLS